MYRGDKPRHTDKQNRQARKMEEGYERRGASAKEAARRAWATRPAEAKRRWQRRRQKDEQGAGKERRAVSTSRPPHRARFQSSKKGEFADGQERVTASGVHSRSVMLVSVHFGQDESRRQQPDKWKDRPLPCPIATKSTGKKKIDKNDGSLTKMI